MTLQLLQTRNMTTQQSTVSNLGSIILGICIFLSVYADEFSSRSMQCIIGRGLSRAKLQAAKFIDCILLTINSYLILVILVFLLNLIFGTNLLPSEKTMIYAAFLTSALKAIGYGTISAIFLYKSSNVAGATVVDILLYMVLFLFIDMIASSAPLAPIIMIHRNCFTGRVYQIYSRIVLGQPFIGILVNTLVIYVGGALGISMLVFRKRELEF